jgi:ferredoxin
LLVIDPAECIDCAVCVPECPVNAIYAEDEVPEAQRAFIALNAQLAPAWPVLRVRKAAHAEAEQWKGKPGKASLLEGANGRAAAERAA